MKGALQLLIFLFFGVILTIVVQSSSVTGAITLTMAYKGWIDYPQAAAIILGENIGTTVTAYLASLTANTRPNEQPELTSYSIFWAWSGC